MSLSLGRQAERLYHVFSELVRAYQFRDREGICCHGISVSQCYALDALDRNGPMTMGELAGHLHLEISSMTRIVDVLVASKLAVRVADSKDRRICRVRLSKKGQSLVTAVRADLVKEYEQVLRGIPSESREAVIAAIAHLLEAFRARQPRASSEASSRSACPGD